MIDTFITIVSYALIIVGCFLLITGAIGLLRFPDFYTRVHAGGVTDTLAVTSVILGLMLLSGWSLALLKLVMILLFIFFTSPAANHALAKSAQHGNLQPIAGKGRKQ